MVLVDRRISTHAPLAGRDYSYGCLSRGNFVFQPTRPLRGATEIDVSAQLVGIRISTHAPLAGRDIQAAINNGKEEYFNPRAPCGARQQRTSQFLRRLDFNPRAPCGARPQVIKGFICFLCISTHAPLAGRDSLCRCPVLCRPDFNPRAPCGARQYCRFFAASIGVFQPTRPLRGATFVVL